MRLRLMVALVVVCTGCASGAGSALFRRDVGMASGSDGLDIGTRVAQQFSYQIAHVDTAGGLRIETEWLKRNPFNDEAGFGVEDAESRLVIVGRPRGRTELGTNYSMVVTVENRLRVGGSSSWNEALNTPMFTEYALRIAETMKTFLTNIGVRRYRQ